MDLAAAVEELQLLMGPELIEAFEKDPLMLLNLVVGQDVRKYMLGSMGGAPPPMNRAATIEVMPY